ncbi:MAG: hypothetical protein Ct9H90mP2_05540 [Dehalococcoidia bacterium]|nr:MAG: hypothetical protein Ct9H90mP2_05540 [Dehalococcoidia bacterium]
MFEKRSGAVFPERSISYLINKSIDNGAVHKYNEKVISWKKESSCYKVITDKNEYLTEKIIFSSGAWIKNLLPSLNLPLKIERQVLFWFVQKIIKSYLTIQIYLIQVGIWIMEKNFILSQI